MSRTPEGARKLLSAYVWVVLGGCSRPPAPDGALPAVARCCGPDAGDTAPCGVAPRRPAGTARARQITADQTKKLPDRSRELIREAVDEYETRETLEARCAKDADKLEMLLQAVEYRDAGVTRTNGWIDSARKDLYLETSRRIAEAATTLSPLSWRDR